MAVDRKGWRQATWTNLIFDTLLTFVQIRRMKITLTRTPESKAKVNISIYIISSLSIQCGDDYSLLVLCNGANLVLTGKG